MLIPMETYSTWDFLEGVPHSGSVNLITCLLVRFDSLHPSQHFISQVRTDLPGLHQYEAEDNVSC